MYLCANKTEKQKTYETLHIPFIHCIISRRDCCISLHLFWPVKLNHSGRPSDIRLLKNIFKHSKITNMHTTIDNNSRVFQIITSLGHQYFCNLHDIGRIVKEMELREGYYTVLHFWNNKPKKVSRKYLKEMLQANGLTFDFNY